MAGLALDLAMVVYEGGLAAVPSTLELFGYARTAKVVSAVGYSSLAVGTVGGVYALHSSTSDPSVDNSVAVLQHFGASRTSGFSDKRMRGVDSTPVRVPAVTTALTTFTPSMRRRGYLRYNNQPWLALGMFRKGARWSATRGRGGRRYARR